MFTTVLVNSEDAASFSKCYKYLKKLSHTQDFTFETQAKLRLVSCSPWFSNTYEYECSRLDTV